MLTRTLIALLLATHVTAQDAEARPDKPATPYSFSGSTDLRYVGRSRGGDHDHDLFDYTRIEYGDPRKHAWTAHASGRVAWDMDRNREPTHPFRTFDDRYSGDVTGRLYTAFIDLNGVAGSPTEGTLKRVRLGRQVLHDLPTAVFLDGLSVQTAALADWGDLIFHGFAGQPTHLFESSASGDFATGGGLSFAPWSNGRLRLDYLHVEDEDGSANLEDELLGLRLDQRVGRNLYFNAFANSIDFEEMRDIGGFVSWNDPESDLNLTARYTALVSNEDKRRSIDLDYYTEILATYYAYQQFEVTAHKGLTDNLYAEGGVQWRELRRDSDEGVFNHEFRRYFATAGIDQWPGKGTDISVTFEYWDSGDDQFTTVGGDLTHDFDEAFSASIGTLFELFRYDALRGQENEDVQVTYGKLTYKLGKDTRLRAKYEFEDGESDVFHTWTLGMQVNFQP